MAEPIPWRFTLQQILGCIAMLAIAMGLATIETSQIELYSDRMLAQLGQATAVIASIGAAIGVLRSGADGFVLGGIAGLVIGALSPLLLWAAAMTYFAFTGQSLMPIPS